MVDALLAALRQRPRFAALTSDDLEPLPATGTAHGHVRLPDGLIARVAYAYEGDAGAAARLETQAAAFRFLAPSGRTPALHDVLPPREVCLKARQQSEGVWPPGLHEWPALKRRLDRDCPDYKT